jgi:hypothetical protein
MAFFFMDFVLFACVAYIATDIAEFLLKASDLFFSPQTFCQLKNCRPEGLTEQDHEVFECTECTSNQPF